MHEYPGMYKEGMSRVLYCSMSDGPGKDWVWNHEVDYKDILYEMGIFGIGSMSNQDQDCDRYNVPSNRGNLFPDAVKNGNVDACFDISGGNCANEILPFLRYRVIKKNGIMIWGYSDLTPVMNAVYVKSGIPSVLYQTRHLVGEDEKGDARRALFKDSVFYKGRLLHAQEVMEGKIQGGLFDFHFDFLQGDSMEGVLLGGNARCFLKLAGTPYMPDMTGKILLLEALGGDRYAVSSYFAQLAMMGVFEKVAGVLLGTFTKLENEEEYGFYKGRGIAANYLYRYIPQDLPVAYTNEIGHDLNAKATFIGLKIRLKKGEPVHYGEG